MNNVFDVKIHAVCLYYPKMIYIGRFQSFPICVGVVGLPPPKLPPIPKKVPHRTPGHDLLPIALTPWLWMRMMISAQWGHSSLDSKDSGRELVLNFWRKRSHWGWGVVGREGSGCLEKDVKIWFVEVETELNFTEISKCPNPFRHLNSSKPKSCRNLWVSSPLTSFRKVS